MQLTKHPSGWYIDTAKLKKMRNRKPRVGDLIHAYGGFAVADGLTYNWIKPLQYHWTTVKAVTVYDNYIMLTGLNATRLGVNDCTVKSVWLPFVKGKDFLPREAIKSPAQLALEALRVRLDKGVAF